MDGRDDDAVWSRTGVTDGFRTIRPVEDSAPILRTAFRVAYDSRNIYFFVRAFDPQPDSIVKPLSRRDNVGGMDLLVVMVDSYRDRRSGFEFGVSAAGVQFDASTQNDGNENSAWDGVWEVVTRIDSLGWTAEYRIPFSQLRFDPAEAMSFGLGVFRRDIRHTEESSWPVIRRSLPGMTSQFGDLVGLVGVSSPERAELQPYLVLGSEPQPGKSERNRLRVEGGLDARYTLAPNVLLNTTFNPDFGQVEADPAQLNLSAFEVFQQEQRPFFVAGADRFDFEVNRFTAGGFNGEKLFYSRRIGRAPVLAGRLGDASTPTATRILGAAKLTGRTSGGLAFGLLDAVSDRINGPLGTVEPRTNLAALSVSQDFSEGRSAVSGMVTSVSRDLDPATEPFLHRSAWSAGLDARHRIGLFNLSGLVMASRVSGSAAALALTQQSPVHYYQRPDDDLEFDSTRTSLSGLGWEARFGKVGGEVTHFETGYGYRSAGLELNDLGYLRQARQRSWNTWLGLNFRQPNRVFRELNWNLNWIEQWSLDGLVTERVFATNLNTQLRNHWWLYLQSTIDVGDRYCDRDCTRGGPALRIEPLASFWVGFDTDDRNSLVGSFWVGHDQGGEGSSSRLSLEPSLTLKLGSRLNSSLGLEWSHAREDAQWFGNSVDAGGAAHHTFAALDQETAGLTWRLNYTLSPSTSFQFYANPFVSKGTWSRVRELADPRAERYQDRYQPWLGESAQAPGGFNVRELRANAVLRWEYRPGSTLFLVWSRGGSGEDAQAGQRSMIADLRQSLREQAENRLMLKLSYWLNW